MSDKIRSWHRIGALTISLKYLRYIFHNILCKKFIFNHLSFFVCNFQKGHSFINSFTYPRVQSLSCSLLSPYSRMSMSIFTIFLSFSSFFLPQIHSISFMLRSTSSSPHEVWVNSMQLRNLSDFMSTGLVHICLLKTISFLANILFSSDIASMMFRS